MRQHERLGTLLPWLAVVLGAALLLLRVPEMAGALAHNRAAVEAVQDCREPGGEGVTGDLWLRVGAARCRGDEEAVRAGLRDALSASPARMQMARSMARHDTELAALAAGKYPEIADAHFWYGEALAEQGDRAGAIEAYERGLELRTGDANMWAALGDLYDAEGDLPEAARAYDQACRYVDNGYNGCSRAGDTYMQMEMYKEAAQRYSDSIRQIPYTWLPSEQGLVNALLALGRTDEAIPHLQVLAQNGSTEAAEKLRELQGEK